MHIYLLLTAFLLFSESKPGGVVSDSNFNIDKDIEILDSAVTRRNEYIEAKIQSIKKFKTSNSYTEGADLYNYNKHLVNEYMKFDSDSALFYAYRCRSIAKREGTDEEGLLSGIDIVFITVLRGDIVKASQLIERLPPIASASSTVRIKTVLTWLEFYLRVLELSPSEAEVYGGKRNIETRCKKLIAMLPQKGWLSAYYNGIIFSKGDRTRLKDLIDRSPEPSIKTAMLCIAMANVCKAQGDRNAYMHYMIVSAINDIKTANREAASLIHIAEWPILDKSSQRASEYLKTCMENVMYYKDRGRSLCLIKAGTAITKAYERRINRYGNTMTMVCALLGVAVVAICVMMRIILKKGQRQLAVLKNMKKMNAKMQTMIKEEKKMKAELEQSNRLLAKEISDRDSHFMDVYLLITKYFRDVEKYKKAVCNMIVCGKTDKARRELSSSAQNEKYLAEFYAQFDRAFLSMHPDFVERMNSLLRPECAITTPQPDTLTPELRIYALVSMGIKDSVSIAEFLNYSPQTIYNYRLRIRHCASIPEKTFAETVAAMYNEQA